jgi:hypothetical protein
VSLPVTDDLSPVIDNGRQRRLVNILFDFLLNFWEVERVWLDRLVGDEGEVKD